MVSDQAADGVPGEQFVYLCAAEPSYIGGAKDPADPSLKGELTLDTRCT